MKYILIFGAVSSFYSLQAQYYSNVRMKKVPGTSMKISLDSLAIVPNSVNVYTSNNRSVFSNYRIDEASGMIEFGESIADSLTIFYRVYDFKIKQRVQSVLWNKREEKRFVYTHTGYTDPATTSLLDFDGLNYSGSFTRGIMFGNTQGLALSSGFNLGLSGKTAQGIEISANLSDANIPIQPDGNTAQVNEFDRIFIKVKKDNHAVIIGDYDLEQSPNAYFLNFNRKLQGLQYMGEFEFRDSVSMKLNAAGAITRGQFTRNELQVQENNQGPYKLRGANNEIFLIVLGNSERVFVNGQLMERGFDKDYTIDYNLGEITFTPRRIITRDLRIFVEFQYSDKNYFRTTLYGNNETKYRNFSFALNAFSEQDNKSQPLNFNLDDSKIKKLSSVGDNLDRAIVPSSTRTTNDGTKVLYRQIDTIVDFVKYDSIYILGTYNDSNLFQVSFSFVGANKGNYIVLSSAANGRVYGWESAIERRSAGRL
ncbi:MAG: hypothetical protein IPK03_15265 [Bacteroidetes bacterium]|nr:hypothetical protein [Bacteroidota bacterium]